MTEAEKEINSLEVFLDTSIQISRFFHETKTKNRIELKLKNFDKIFTGLVVRSEFKKAVLANALYYLNKIKHYNSVAEANKNIKTIQLPPRKFKILMLLESKVFESLSSNEEELTERSKRYLRTLILHGLHDFDKSVDQVNDKSGCSYGKKDPKEIKPFRFEELNDKQTCPEGCRIKEFLTQEKETCQKILNFLEEHEETITEELKTSAAFLRTLLENPESSSKLLQKPCRKVGDLLIALESSHISNFLTINKRESEYFCPILSQTMHFLPANPDTPEEIHPPSCLPIAK